MKFGPGELFISRQQPDGTLGAPESLGECGGFTLNVERGELTVPPMPGPFVISALMTDGAVRLWRMICDPEFAAMVKRFRAQMRAKLRGKNWRTA